MTFWVLALCQLANKLSAFNLIAKANLHLFINLADNEKVLWYNYIMLPLIPLISLGHQVLVPLFVTVIVFHNWYIVTVVLLLVFSDFLTLSLIQGLFSWTQETQTIQGRRTCWPFFLPFLKLAFILSICINPLIVMSDQDRISPYNINTISTREVMRVKKCINFGMITVDPILL